MATKPISIVILRNTKANAKLVVHRTNRKEGVTPNKLKNSQSCRVQPRCPRKPRRIRLPPVVPKLPNPTCCFARNRVVNTKHESNEPWKTTNRNIIDATKTKEHKPNDLQRKDLKKKSKGKEQEWKSKRKRKRKKQSCCPLWPNQNRSQWPN